MPGTLVGSCPSRLHAICVCRGPRACDLLPSAPLISHPVFDCYSGIADLHRRGKWRRVLFSALGTRGWRRRGLERVHGRDRRQPARESHGASSESAFGERSPLPPRLSTSTLSRPAGHGRVRRLSRASFADFCRTAWASVFATVLVLTIWEPARARACARRHARASAGVAHGCSAARTQSWQRELSVSMTRVDRTPEDPRKVRCGPRDLQSGLSALLNELVAFPC